MRRKADLVRENEDLRRIVRDFAWMARRYCDGRSSYAPGLFNEHTRMLLGWGVKLNPTADNTLFARDEMGRTFDGLTPEQVAEMEAAETAVQAQVANLQDELRRVEHERDVLVAFSEAELSIEQAALLLGLDMPQSSQVWERCQDCITQAAAAWRMWREQHPPEVPHD